ncbi:MAG: FAD-dependent oxidoreductase [Clostridiales bacterium]|jgi:glycerol-3-phosphate dehydrogenase|nr:FAD-dependent oxidoreductase [Clostridiales bacterium]
MYDVAIIGGGVVGSLIARELSRLKLEICVLEAQADCAMGASGANSAIVHAGFDALPGSNKALFNVAGNRMMPYVARELGVEYKRNGSLVVAFSDDDLVMLQTLCARGLKNGVTGLSIVDKPALQALEPNIAPEAVGALLAETAGIVCPYGLNIAALGNAMDNGADAYFNFRVTEITHENGTFVITASNRALVQARVIVNAAGTNSDDIARLVGDDSFYVGARKGEYVLLDRESGDLVSHTLFTCPSAAGKGVLVTPTPHGNLLVGPTSEEQEDKEDAATSREGLAFSVGRGKQLVARLPLYNTITSFAGLRAFSSAHDFIIGHCPTCRGVIHVAGIESPGLTSAPAIAVYVAELVKELLPAAKPNPAFNPIRVPTGFFADMDTDEKNAFIKRYPAFGRIMCRCEEVTEGELRYALQRNPVPHTLDGLKRRTRGGMGRCQGGFCQVPTSLLVQEVSGTGLCAVTKRGGGSYVYGGLTK